MKKQWNRLLCLALCMVMVAGLLPVGTVAEASENVTVTKDVKMAESLGDGVFAYTNETVTETYKLPAVQQNSGKDSREKMFSIVDSGDGDYTFSTFEDLQELAAMEYDSYSNAQYVGSEPLTISASQQIPEKLRLFMDQSELIIPEGVEFVCASYISAGKVTVNGVAQIDGSMQVQDDLTVRGRMLVADRIHISADTAVSGRENITFLNAWSGLFIGLNVMADTDPALMTQLAEKTHWDNFFCELYFMDSCTITDDFTLSEGSFLDISQRAEVTIADGATLENYGQISSTGTLKIEGRLINHGLLSIYNINDTQLVIAEGGSYSGEGEISIRYDDAIDLGNILVGLDLSQFEIRYYAGDSKYVELRYIAGLTKLATPVNPEWGYQYRYDGQKTAFPGSIGWQPMEPTQGRALVEVYKVGEKMPAASYAWLFGSGNVPQWRSIPSFCMDDMESGTYYFTVRAEGDNITYASSDPVTSATWTYIKPSAQVGQCGNISWNWPRISYTAPEDMTNVGGYEVEFYYAHEEDVPSHLCSATWSYYADSIFTAEVSDWMIQQYGNGCYYFRVRALSQDITVARNGEWSELSPAYNLSELTSGVKSDLENVVNASDSMSDEEIRDAVQDMDTADLKTAMLADQNVVDDVAALENKVGGPAPVEVSGEASAFDQSKVSIVGANLNNAKSEEDPIKLVIDKPEKEHVLDTLYDSSVAVKFSMDLENVEDTRNLEVPVKITLPIPSTINPGFLVILHYHADGSVEELTLGNDVYVFEEDGQRYASFVLTSFSDFVLTQLVPGIPSVPMHRMYDPNSGEHFYTGAELERDFLVEAGWHYEGVGFNFPEEGAPVHRLYEPVNGEHLYTMDQAEVDKLLGWGWQYEGVAFNSAGDDEVPQYRLHNPNAKRGGYHFTGSEMERDLLISLGWIDQGIGWYSCKE